MTHIHTGHKRAQRLFPLGPCERCGLPAHDRHHRDGNPHNNMPSNIEILCRRCHQIVDGRIDVLRANSARQAEKQAAKTHCPRGHPYDEDNTYIRPGTNKRTCRACRRIPGGYGRRPR